MKKIILLFFALTPLLINAQKSRSTKIGLATIEELKMPIYEKDSSAKAVVLYDHANVYVDPKNDFDFRTDYYKRIKLFDKTEVKKATIKIISYKEEKITAIKGLTYNANGDFIQKTYITPDKIFEKQLSENHKETTFTLPNINNGAVIEYSYSKISPYGNLNDWYFQEDIPKIKSDYTSSIPLNWKYNTRLVGTKKLDNKYAKIRKDCIYIVGLNAGNCVDVKYQMNEIPAFKEESYMLSKENFISKIIFDLVSYTSVKGDVRKYTQTWKSAEKTLRNKFLDGQTSKQNYFKRNLPEKLNTISTELEKAKAIYHHIQQRIAWNHRYWSSEKINVKDVYENKTGSVDGINLALYNSLKANNIESYIVVLSTRNNGLPTKLFPIVKDFNYVIVKTVINGKSYFLDATDDFLPFGEVPMRCLNGEARILDFKNDSYWEVIKPRFKTSERKTVRLEFSPEKGFTGNANFVYKGYAARDKRIEYYQKNTDEKLDATESEYSNIEADNFKLTNENNYEKPLVVNFDFSVDDTESLQINPFSLDKVVTNPFKLKQRDYPVDYGYPRTNNYLFNLKIPEGYKLKKLPKNLSISLPNNGGKYILNVKESNNSVSIYSKLVIAKKLYSSDEYYYLKEFYNQIINAQNTYITLEKL